MKHVANAAGSWSGTARLLVCIVLFAFAGLFAARSAAEQAATRSKVRLAISEFVMLSGNARFDFLRRGIPEVLGTALLSEDGLVLSGPDAFRAKLGRPGPSTLSQLPQRGQSGDMARDFDYVVQGSYFEFDGKLVVSASLLATRNNREVKLGPVTMDERRIVPGIESVAASVLAALRKQGAGGNTRSFAVSCFEDRSSPPSELSKLAKRDLALFLIGQLGTRRGAQVVDWSKVESSCDSPLRDSTMARQLDVDAVISGSFNVENDILYVVPALYVSDDGVRFDMPTVSGPVAQYLQLKVEVGKKVNTILDGAIGSDGKWNVAELVRTTRPEDKLKRGLELYDQGNLSLAILYLELAAASKSVPDALYYLGTVQSKQRRFDEAARNLERYVQLKPESGNAYRELGLAYAGLRKYDEALAAYERALKVSPSLQGVRVDMGNVYFSQGKFDDAKRYYLDAAKDAPNDWAPRFNLGLVAERQDDENEAVRWYADALRVKPQDADTQKMLANVFHRKGVKANDQKDYALATKEFTEEIAYQPTARGYFSRAYAREYLAAQQPKPDYGEAIKDYLEVVERSSDVSGDAGYYISSMLNVAEIYILSKQYSDARDISKRAFESSKDSPMDRQISGYLLVVSQILLGADHAAALAVLQREVADSKEKVSTWDFALLDNFYTKTSSISEPQRRLLLQVTQEFKKTATSQGK